ncbi:hypothetical protein BH24ACT15_BH24ACT15_05430 [soil metagenome]
MRSRQLLAPTVVFLLTFSLLLGAQQGWQVLSTNAEATAAQHRLRQDFTPLGRQSREIRQEEDLPLRVRLRSRGRVELPPANAASKTSHRSGGKQRRRPGSHRQPISLSAGEPLARIRFVRPGRGAIVSGPLVVVQGTGSESLAKGPGRYAGTALPGRPGNFAVAGHRTTYGGPFYHLDKLRPGDRIHVKAVTGGHVYEVRRTAVLDARETWALRPYPLHGRRPLMTLTTCAPVFSDAKRLVVWAALL